MISLVKPLKAVTSAVKAWFNRPVSKKSLPALMFELVALCAVFSVVALLTVALLWLGLEGSMRYIGTVSGPATLFALAYLVIVGSTSRKIGRMGPDGYNLYLRRFYLTPRIPLLNVRFFLHHILRSDDDKWPHDHPWPFTSLILAGKYIEHVFYPNPYRPGRRERLGRENHATRGTILRNPAEHAHKIEIVRPVWSLVLAGGGEREWGFWVMDGTGPDKWVQWEEYLGIKPGTEVHGEDRIMKSREPSCPGFDEEFRPYGPRDDS